MNDSPSKLKGLMWVAAAVILGVIFALGLSPLAHVIPWSWEKKAGQLFVSNNVCHSNPQAQVLLLRVVKRIYPVSADDAVFSVDVRVVKDPAVNAYAGLGGNIAVNSGLLKQAESPEELAGVLAHEIGHVQHRDILEGVIAHLLTARGIDLIFGGHSSAAQWSQYFLNMNFTRTQEAQADEEGLKRLQASHVDNRAFSDFFERLEKSGSVPVFLSDHPANHARSEMAAKFDNKGAIPIMNREEWLVLKNYCGKNGSVF